MNFRASSNKYANLHGQTDGTSVPRDSSIVLENSGQPHDRTQQSVGKRDLATRVEHASNSVTFPTPDATETSFGSVYSQYNSRHTSPKNNKRGKNKKKGSQSTTQTTPSQKGSLTALPASFSQHGTDHRSELLSKSDYSRLGQAKKDQLDRIDFRKPRHQCPSENDFDGRNYSSHLASDGSPKKKMRKPGSKAARGRDQASIARAMKDYNNELRQIASSERSSKEIGPLSYEEWPSLAEFSTQVTSPERYSPPIGRKQGTTPERSVLNRNTVVRSSTSKTPKTPLHETLVEAIVQIQGTDGRTCQLPPSMVCNEKDLETTPIESKTAEDEDKLNDAKMTSEAAQSIGENPGSLLHRPILDQITSSNTSQVEALDELAQETGEYNTNANLSPSIIQSPRDTPTELSRNEIIRAPEVQSVEGSERTETIIDSSIEGSKLDDKDEELESAEIQQVSLSSHLVERSIAEHETSVLMPEDTITPEVKTKNVKEIDNGIVISSLNSKLAENSPSSSHRDEETIVAQAPSFVPTLLLDTPDMEKEIEDNTSSQPPETSRGASAKPVSSAISTHKKRQNKRAHIGESFPRKVKAPKRQPSDKRKSSNSELDEVSKYSRTTSIEGTDSGMIKEEAVSEDLSSPLIAKLGGSLELSSENRNYPQVNEAHAVENLYVPAKKPSFLRLWPFVQIQTQSKTAQLHPLLLCSTASENKVEEVDTQEKINAAILNCAHTEERLTSTPLPPSSDIERKLEGAPEAVLDVRAGQSSEAKEYEAPSMPQPITEEKPSDLKKKKAKGKKKKKKSCDASTAEYGATPATAKKAHLMNSPIGLTTVDSDDMFPPLGSSKVKHKQAVLSEAKDDVVKTNAIAKNPNASPKGKARAISDTPHVILLNASMLPKDQQPEDGRLENVAASIANYYQKKPTYTAKIVHELENRMADGHSEASTITSGSNFMPADQSTNASDNSDSGPPTQLSEASMKQHQESLTVDAGVVQPFQHRRAGSVAMSELSTTSSRQRKLFSEVASSADRAISPVAKATNSTGGKGYLKENEKEKAVAGVSIFHFLMVGYGLQIGTNMSLQAIGHRHHH